MLVLTTFDLDEYVYEALRAGASGFLLKDAPPRASSSTAVRTVAAGEALLAPAVTRRLIERVRAPAAAAPTTSRARRADPARARGAAALARGRSNAEIAASWSSARRR